jgi:two-component system phosphate regulon response regulator PhoB
MYNLLIIDDEIAILKMLTSVLKSKYKIKQAINGKTAINFIKTTIPDLIIVDWMLPDINGDDIIKWLRADKKYEKIPIIMLTAKSTEIDKLKGFEAGADDYISKPFSINELQARIKALLVRSIGAYKDIISFNQLELNLSSHKFLINNTQVTLTLKEFKLLELLIKNPDTVYSREQIISLAWEPNSNITPRAVDVCVSRIRKILIKNNCNLLNTVRGWGYKLNGLK